MAKEKETKKSRLPAKPFKKGNQLAKGHGRPTLTPEEKQLAITTRTQFKAILMKYMSWNRGEIQNALDQASLPIMHMIVLKHLLEGLDSGSMQRVDWTLDHIMGKKTEKQHVKIEAITDSQIDPKKLSKEDLLRLKEIHEKAGKE